MRNKTGRWFVKTTILNYAANILISFLIAVFISHFKKNKIDVWTWVLSILIFLATFRLLEILLTGKTVEGYHMTFLLGLGNETNSKFEIFSNFILGVLFLIALIYIAYF